MEIERFETKENLRRIYVAILVDKANQKAIIIGKGGETINRIIAETGAEIDIQDSGLVTVAAVNGDSIKAAMQMIMDIVAEPEVGKIEEPHCQPRLQRPVLQSQLGVETEAALETIEVV